MRKPTRRHSRASTPLSPRDRVPRPQALPLRTPGYPRRAPKRRRLLPGDTPAERLFENGARSLTNAELLALVLGSGTDEVARRVLRETGSLARLARTPLGQIARFPGLSPVRMGRLAAALELGRRGVFPSDGRVPCFQNPAEVARYLLSRYGNQEVEEFGVLLLDARGCLLRAEIISRGSLTGAPVHPRDLYRVAVTHQAASVVLFHNHPSGDPRPSKADQHLTRRLVEAGEVMGIPVLDHLVIGAGRWHSFGENGQL